MSETEGRRGCQGKITGEPRRGRPAGSRLVSLAMRVARLHGRGDLRVHEEERPAPGPGETRVRVQAVGVCGSDLHWYAEGGIGRGRVTRPFVLGHEFGGVTEDGRTVAVDPAVPCEACERCREGHANLCPEVRFAGD